MASNKKRLTTLIVGMFIASSVLTGCSPSNDDDISQVQEDEEGWVESIWDDDDDSYHHYFHSRRRSSSYYMGHSPYMHPQVNYNPNNPLVGSSPQSLTKANAVNSFEQTKSAPGTGGKSAILNARAQGKVSTTAVHGGLGSGGGRSLGTSGG